MNKARVVEIKVNCVGHGVVLIIGQHRVRLLRGEGVRAVFF